jgi:hypothetical protein
LRHITTLCNTTFLLVFVRCKVWNNNGSSASIISSGIILGQNSHQTGFATVDSRPSFDNFSGCLFRITKTFFRRVVFLLINNSTKIDSFYYHGKPPSGGNSTFAIRVVWFLLLWLKSLQNHRGVQLNSSCKTGNC